MVDDIHDPDSHFIQSLYRFLGLNGIHPSDDVIVNYDQDPDEGNGHVMLAIPGSKVGISTIGDRPDPLLEAGWFIYPISINNLKLFHNLFTGLKGVVVEHNRRMTMETVKQTSRHEQWLIDAVIRRGLPTPDRNYRFTKDDGKELTTPDMVWEKYRLAFFVDGLWWHRTKDDKKAWDSLKEDEKALFEEERTRSERDSEIRSELALRGWTVLSCSDRQLESDDGVREQVMKIERAIKRIKKEDALVKEQATSSNSTTIMDEIEDLLS